MSAAPPLSDADLHGVIDGHIEAGRRTEILRRLAAAPAERAKIDAWQAQNDLLKSAFLGIEKEPLPPSLRLVPTPTLHCIPRAETSIVEERRLHPSRTHHRRALVGIASVLLIVGGLSASWMLIQSADKGPQLGDMRLRGTVDETLAMQTADAVETDAARRVAKTATAEPDIPPVGLPTTTIPDLTPAGFTFISADSPPSRPRSLVFHYRNAGAERVVVGVIRAPQVAGAGPTRIGRSFSWHRDDNAFAIAGTVRSERLRAMATLLQNAGSDE